MDSSNNSLNAGHEHQGYKWRISTPEESKQSGRIFTKDKMVVVTLKNGDTFTAMSIASEGSYMVFDGLAVDSSMIKCIHIE